MPPKSFAKTGFSYKPPYVGTAKLVANFTSNEMNDVDGLGIFKIAPNPRYFNNYL